MIIYEIEAKYRYQEYLKEVEHAQLCSQFKKSKPFNTILKFLGNVLIGVSQQLKGKNQPEQVSSISS